MKNTEYEEAISEFLASGGVIQQIATGVQSETATTNFWGSPIKKKVNVETTDVNAVIDMIG